MARPSKPVAVLSQEKKSHRTKAELRKRQEEEAKTLSGVEIKERKEVKDNKDAHKEFIRIKKLLKNIEKNDSLYEAVINRYALIQAECRDFEVKRESFQNDLDELTEKRDDLIDNDEMTLSEYFKTKVQMQGKIIDLDKQVQAKRKMLFEIEKENLMTIAAALRGIPKKESADEDPLLRVLKGSG